eukprot:COSAG02_NODE_9400_length_2229_cov_2.378404_1_plen_315_part_00
MQAVTRVSAWRRTEPRVEVLRVADLFARADIDPTRGPRHVLCVIQSLRRWESHCQRLGDVGGALMKTLLSLVAVALKGATADVDAPRTSCPPVNKPALEAALQALTTAEAQQWNTSFSTGIAYCDDTQAGVAAGLDDIFARTPMTRDTMVPSGSVTKPWTAVAILQMVAEGAVQLDTPAHTVVDPGLQLACTKGQPCPPTTMLQLWNGEPQVQRITIKDLLGHTSGIAEYPGSLQTDTLAGKEYNPIELIGITSKNLSCAAVPCPRYYSFILVLPPHPLSSCTWYAPPMLLQDALRTCSGSIPAVPLYRCCWLL